MVFLKSGSITLRYSIFANWGGEGWGRGEGSGGGLVADKLELSKWLTLATIIAIPRNVAVRGRSFRN